MLRFFFATLAIIGFFSTAAQATITNPQAYSGYSVAVSTSSVEVVPANEARRYLLIQNVCANNIGVSVTGTTAAIGTAGTITLFPGGSIEFREKDVPQNALNAISASGSCGVTIWEMR